ncbi:helix-turn-helix domain-containing protein [Mucilaginibacter dorajii]|uniref:HTH cro/C1-type domain-containing protein n=1 Tax=Mucilaginibacter dorajii TaxID=692994 RepID=A0ABP7PXY6_9SPHI|nr:helix-turn-helix domain-containing protein [Mucilaginibacter dorajii]MCS3737977.1 transcriptional regulator with XRE-family HTH domain [Mucilaginibacter dorajii]
MDPNEKIIAQRKAKGLTQEELAALTRVNLRTIQRIESGESKPRPFTIKAIANALDLGLTNLRIQPLATNDQENTTHFLQLFCISCFSYLIIPYVHFLIPNYLLKLRKEQNPEVRNFAKKVIREQVYWVVATMLVFLIILLINFIARYELHTPHYISYLIPFFGMYALNILLILNSMNKARALPV